MVFVAQLQRVNPFSSHTILVMNGPLLSDGDLFLRQLWAEGGGTAGCVLPLRSKTLMPRVGMHVGRGPALTLLSAAFLWHFLSLFIPPHKLVEGEMRLSPALGPEPSW